MARGRKKDLSIPPTRSLVQQRDYRARRAQYITSLEERCRSAEEENSQLRKDLAEARERLVNPAVLLPETAAASSELLHHISAARDALVKFTGLVFPNTQGSGEVTLPPINHTPSSCHIDSATPLSFTSHSHNGTKPRRRKELYVDTSPSASPTTTMFDDPSSNSGECCGGMIDCDELCDDEDDDSIMTMSRTSGMRSTST